MSAPKLHKVIRLDSFPLNQTFFTPEGYLRDRPILTRTGIFEYNNPDGTIRRELRLPEEVFAPDSLASYKGKPVIISHDAGLIDKANVHENSIGTILSEGYRSNDAVRAEIVIHDTDAMRESNFKELSLGYNLDLDETPGEWNGQHYDAIQRNIRINHLALVMEARAGDKARLNIDGRSSKNFPKGGNEMENSSKKNATRKDGILTPEQLEQATKEYKAKHSAPAKEPAATDGDEKEAPVVESTPPATEAVPAEEKKDSEPVAAPAAEEKPPVEEQVEALKDAHKDADADMQKLFDIIDTLLAEREFKKSEGEQHATAPAAAEDCGENCDEEEEAAPAAPAAEMKEDGDDEAIPSTEDGDLKGTVNADSVDRMVRARIQVGMMGQALNLDGLESMPLMAARKAVIKAVRPKLNLDGKSTAFVNAAYDMACDEIKDRKSKDTSYQKRQMFNKDSAAVEADTSSASARRNEMIARQQKRGN